VRLPAAEAMSRRPTHAVTPVASSPSLTTNSAAMKITVGSPNPSSPAEPEHAGRPQRQRDADRRDRRGDTTGGEHDHQRDVRHQRREHVRGRVADAVGGEHGLGLHAEAEQQPQVAEVQVLENVAEPHGRDLPSTSLLLLTVPTATP